MNGGEVSNAPTNVGATMGGDPGTGKIDKATLNGGYLDNMGRIDQLIYTGGTYRTNGNDLSTLAINVRGISTYSGDISGSGTLTLSGSSQPPYGNGGTLTLTGNNTYRDGAPCPNVRRYVRQ